VPAGGPSAVGGQRGQCRAPAGQLGVAVGTDPADPLPGQKRWCCWLSKPQQFTRVAPRPVFRAASSPAADFAFSPVVTLPAAGAAFPHCQVVDGRAQHALPGARRHYRPAWVRRSDGRVFESRCGLGLRRVGQACSRPESQARWLPRPGPPRAGRWRRLVSRSAADGGVAAGLPARPVFAARRRDDGRTRCSCCNSSSLPPRPAQRTWWPAQLAPTIRGPSGAWSSRLCVPPVIEAGCWRPRTQPGPAARLSCLGWDQFAPDLPNQPCQFGSVPGDQAPEVARLSPTPPHGGEHEARPR